MILIPFLAAMRSFRNDEVTKGSIKKCPKKWEKSKKENLLNPLYLVFIFAMKSFSLSFRTAGSELNIFSKIVTDMSETLCPFWLKCSPVAFVNLLLTT